MKDAYVTVSVDGCWFKLDAKINCHISNECNWEKSIDAKNHDLIKHLPFQFKTDKN